MNRVTVRPYLDADRRAVLAIFESNLPEYFGDGDRTWLEETLDEPEGPAFVVEVDRIPAAFGGYEVWEHYNKALLYWGMAMRACHGSGLGKLLLFERLLHVAQVARPVTRYVTVDTSPLIAPFFRHCGFELTSRWPAGYRSGMDMHELRFDLAATPLGDIMHARNMALTRAEALLEAKRADGKHDPRSA